ncbi:hypothetical protein BASA50_009163 [Batrachochytrium salamandrivorans]|uniref:MARVEL domain-containing protein n=1 Tax=Batrachochytrium salamandrivorans TaxID=1357716 RepID=A0ABQ8F257_9FUNG|nr:hypothetical protein BASA62_009621 [Batrachochytrium salamandrivorans]KAH6576127.1 hypothetical protein BASA60_004682 [Batrachochytrium salamandrivorans]KAH6590785.1 hypothetical protein BASA50_009163 [Batrachochytrium salamandrivorans]KAH6602911.1 hypothetical protein BASA61_000627 [Batrachochytrium salamandrivorans]KAJ1345034.1 hypothetical protein BSLG_000549 [Batrachochytrium salamandrivorans]
MSFNPQQQNLLFHQNQWYIANARTQRLATVKTSLSQILASSSIIVVGIAAYGLFVGSLVRPGGSAWCAYRIVINAIMAMVAGRCRIRNIWGILYLVMNSVIELIAIGINVRNNATPHASCMNDPMCLADQDGSGVLARYFSIAVFGVLWLVNSVLVIFILTLIVKEQTAEQMAALHANNYAAAGGVMRPESNHIPGTIITAGPLRVVVGSTGPIGSSPSHIPMMPAVPMVPISPQFQPQPQPQQQQHQQQQQQQHLSPPLPPRHNADKISQDNDPASSMYATSAPPPYAPDTSHNNAGPSGPSAQSGYSPRHQ